MGAAAGRGDNRPAPAPPGVRWMVAMSRVLACTTVNRSYEALAIGHPALQLGAPSARGGRVTMPPDDPRSALQRAQDEAARKWLEAGAKGRPPVDSPGKQERPRVRRRRPSGRARPRRRHPHRLRCVSPGARVERCIGHARAPHRGPHRPSGMAHPCGGAQPRRMGADTSRPEYTR